MASLAARWRAVGDSAGALLGAAIAPDDAGLRRLAASLGRVRVAPFLRLAAARWSADRDQGRPAPGATRVRSVYRRMVRTAFRDPIELADLALDGEDLRDAGIPPGPVLGKILHALLDWVVEDPARNVRDLLLARARELYEAMSRREDIGRDDDSAPNE
jgi:tRNA nucleotidyltransferase (CCA-adding enzyme)